MSDKLEQASTATTVLPAEVTVDSGPTTPGLVVLQDDRGDEVRAAQNVPPPAITKEEGVAATKNLPEEQKSTSESVEIEPMVETETRDPRDNVLTRAGESIEHGSVAGAFTNLGEDVARGSTAHTASAYAGAAKDALSDIAGHREDVASSQGQRSLTAPVVGAAAEGAESFERGKVAGAVHDLGESVAHGKVAQFAAAAGEKIKMAGEKIGEMWDREHRGRAGEPKSSEPPRSGVVAVAGAPAGEQPATVDVIAKDIHEQVQAPLRRIDEAQELNYPPENHPALEGQRTSRTLHETPTDPARPPPPITADAEEKATTSAP